MSEVKTNEPVKQEGEFKIKKKTPKKLTTPISEPVKVNIKEPLVEVPAEVTKVVIPKEDAIQIGETTEVLVEEPSGDSIKVGEQVQKPVEDAKEFTPIKEVEVAKVEAEVKEALRDEKVLGKQLPENIVVSVGPSQQSQQEPPDDEHERKLNQTLGNDNS